MHYDAIRFLFMHWDVVVLSTTSPGGLCERSRRPFGSRTARAACAWNHFAFRQKTKNVAARLGTKHVLEVDEAYTTRTCGLCGTLNDTVGDAKTFQCVDPHCGVHIDRDVNGARNILLRELTRRWAAA
jgi:transposase